MGKLECLAVCHGSLLNLRISDRLDNIAMCIKKKYENDLTYYKSKCLKYLSQWHRLRNIAPEDIKTLISI